MAKKESNKAPKPEKAKAKKGKKDAPATGMPPSMSTPGAVPNAAGGGLPSLPSPGMSVPSVPLANIPPEQMTSAQIEQALRESSDPESHLKKLHSPISVKSCLLNILALIVLTIGIVLLWSYLAVDKFNFVDVVTDMSKQFGITDGFKWLWAQISGWFS